MGHKTKQSQDLQLFSKLQRIKKLRRIEENLILIIIIIIIIIFKE
jgi:hypothetical protein